MAFLEIVHMTGEVERKKLSKQQPLTIGSHASTDITIDEDDVEILHSRISWGKSGYEAVAAGTEPIEVNGNLVQRAVLKAGDTLRFGSVDVRFRDSQSDGQDAVIAEENNRELGLKPLSEEISISRPSASRKAAPPVDDINEDDLIDDDLDLIDEDEDLGGGDLAAGLAALAAESKKSPGDAAGGQSKKKSKAKGTAASSSSTSAKNKPASTALQEQPAKTVAREEPGTQSPPVSRQEDEFSPRLREALRNRQRRRPGEEDPLRSPLVLGLGGGAVVLMLTAAIFYFMAFRQTTQQKFDQAKAIYDEGKFQNAIVEFQNFIIAHPRQEITEEAKTLLGLARVRQQIEGATPNFAEGLDQLRAFIRENSERDDAFEALHPEIVTHARKIAVEAAQTAGKRFDPALLQISREARTILNTYAPKDAPPTETLNQIETALRVSEAAILKNGVYLEHVARMEAALASENPAETAPMEALKARRDLLVRYPRTSPSDRTSFETDKKVVELFNKAISLEQKKVTPVETDAEAATADHEQPSQPLTLAFHGRTKIDEVSVGKSVIAVAKDCCYGIDFVTGEPVWRRSIGLDTPFFPIQEAELPSTILFDTNFLELVRINQSTGQLVWRQPIGDFIRGTPLLVENTIYAATESGRLLAIDLATGLLASELNFSQAISAPVELKDEQHLFVAGNEEVAYTIRKRPFECVQVSYLGHQPASIDAPLLAMGPYVLMIENKTQSATMRLLDASDPQSAVKQVATAELGGRVIDDPVIRGRDLFVPATGERIHAFSVSDDPGQPPLTSGPVFEGQGAAGASINLLTGPNGQVWMATDSLNRLQLTTDSLQPEGNPSAPGMASQPLQMFSGFLLNARRRPYTDAVTFTRTNREDMTSDWQVVLGGKILAWTAKSDGALNVAAVNEAGHVFRIGERQLSEFDFQKEASVRLPLNPDLADPLIAAEISGERLAVACGNPEPRVWLINAAGQIEGSPRIPEPLQAPPVSLGTRVVLPLPGRLHVLRLSGQSAVQDFLLPSGMDDEWRSVLSVSDKQLVGVTRKGRVILLALQTSPRPHLTEVATVELGADVLMDIAASDQVIAIADSSKTLKLFETVRLDQVGERTFAQPLSNRPFLLNDLVIVESGNRTLHVMDIEGVKERFTFSLSLNSVAGVFSTASHLVIAQQNGLVSFLNPATGDVVKQQNVNAVLDAGPVRLGTQLFVIAVDGTLFRIEEPS